MYKSQVCNTGHNTSTGVYLSSLPGVDRLRRGQICRFVVGFFCICWLFFFFLFTGWINSRQQKREASYLELRWRHYEERKDWVSVCRWGPGWVATTLLSALSVNQFPENSPDHAKDFKSNRFKLLTCHPKCSWRSAAQPKRMAHL